MPQQVQGVILREGLEPQLVADRPDRVGECQGELLVTQLADGLVPNFLIDVEMIAVQLPK